jgi:beta-galactosidase
LGGDPLGLTAKYATMPVGRDLIAARAPYCAELQTFSLLSDGRLGQGRLIGSQFDACARWRVDSAATLYLRNLLASLMNQPPKELKDFDESGADFSSSKRAEFAFVDLKPKANMGFKDEVAGDGKGGWTDQGDNDFRTMPLGRQTLRGIPFEIVDPATNGGKSCLVVKDNPKGDFKSSIEGVAIGRKFSRLFFLHGEAFVSSGKTLKYTLHYEDGSSVEIPTAENVSIADWWSAGDLSGARLGINRKNKVDRDVGLLIMDWENPHPEKTIASLDLTAPEGKDAISMLVALTGELPSGRRIEVGGPNWARIADAGNGNILKTGALIPSVSPIPSLGPDAIAVKMPGRSDADPKPVVFRRFLKSEEAKALPGNFNYLVFEIKGLAPGEIQLMLPDENFKNNFKYSLAVDKDAEFHTVRIPLDAFEAPAKNARGEFYVFNTGKTPCEFQLKNLRIE